MKAPYKHGGKISFVSRHMCKLDPLVVQHELPTVAPFAPYCRKFLNVITTWIIASRWNPQCKIYFRSNFALFKERSRQLRNKRYRSIIHPLSRFAMIRQMVVCVLWVAAFAIDPFVSAFINDYTGQDIRKGDHRLLQMILNCLFLVDILIQFFVGFTVERTKEIVLERRRIVRHYVNSYFTFDLIAVLNGLSTYIINVETVKQSFHVPSSVYTWLSIPQLYCARFVRIYTMCVYFSQMLHFFHIRESIVKCATIALGTLVVVHWWTCILFLVPSISVFLGQPFRHSYVLRTALGGRRSLDSLYIECLLNTICHFLGAGKGNMDTKNPFEQLTLAVILMCGLTCHIYVIAVILQLFGTINVSETKYEELIYQLNEYMVTKKLPQVLRERLLMYYEYRFQKQFFKESAILNSLSEHLRYEVLLYSCRNLINKVKLFQGASKEVIGALVAMLKHEIYLPNDHIIKPETLNENIYFISFGTVAIYLPNGKEAYHLEDGHHFGEVQIIMHGAGEEYLFSVIAVEITEVFYLDKRDFWYVVARHPEIADILENSAIMKLTTLKNLAAESAEETLDTSDILMELRKGRILDRGRRRL